MADLITETTFEARTGRSLDATESTQVGGLITDASAIVIDIVGDGDITDTWTDSTVPDAVVPVVVNMVRRALDNPDGYTGEAIDGYSYSGAKGHGIYATRGERKTILKAAGQPSVRALDLEGHLPRSYREVYTGDSASWLDGAL